MARVMIFSVLLGSQALLSDVEITADGRVVNLTQLEAPTFGKIFGQSRRADDGADEYVSTFTVGSEKPSAESTVIKQIEGVEIIRGTMYLDHLWVVESTGDSPSSGDMIIAVGSPGLQKVKATPESLIEALNPTADGKHIQKAMFYKDKTSRPAHEPDTVTLKFKPMTEVSDFFNYFEELKSAVRAGAYHRDFFGPHLAKLLRKKLADGLPAFVRQVAAHVVAYKNSEEKWHKQDKSFLQQLGEGYMRDPGHNVGMKGLLNVLADDAIWDLKKEDWKAFPASMQDVIKQVQAMKSMTDFDVAAGEMDKAISVAPDVHAGVKSADI